MTLNNPEWRNDHYFVHILLLIQVLVSICPSIAFYTSFILGFVARCASQTKVS